MVWVDKIFFSRRKLQGGGLNLMIRIHWGKGRGLLSVISKDLNRNGGIKTALDHLRYKRVEG